jgi:hypothetical protein
MPNLTNSEVVEHVLHGLISKISRRTSEAFAVVALDVIIKELRQQYNFLKYIEVQDTSYSEGIDALKIYADINSVESDIFYKCLNDIIIHTVRYLKRKADYFFIKEFKEFIDRIDNLKMDQVGIDLSHMQLQYIVDRRKVLKINNAEVVENVVSALIRLIGKNFPEKQVIMTIREVINKFKEKYNFLNNITISDTPNKHGFYPVIISSEINNIHSLIISEAIKDLIEDVGRLTEWENEAAFIETLKAELGDDALSKIEKIGVNLNHIQIILLRKGHESLVKKALEAIIDLIDERTSKGFAVVTIDTIIDELKDTHDVLNYIEIDKSQYSKGIDAINVMSDINIVESYKLGKAIREIIKMTHKYLGKKTYHFIEDFKNKLGNKYLTEIENMGVNLHFLEMKFT